jgi:hypothetical protein
MRLGSVNRLGLLAAVTAAGAGATVFGGTEPVAWGDWSAASNGLSGRLLVAYESVSNHPPTQANVFLELHYDGCWRHPIELFYGTWDGCPLSWELTDSSGKPVKADIVSVHGSSPAPDWLVLPEGASLRFGVGWTSVNPMHPNGLSIGLNPHQAWTIPEDSEEDYYLSGKFEITPRWPRLSRTTGLLLATILMLGMAGWSFRQSKSRESKLPGRWTSRIPDRWLLGDGLPSQTTCGDDWHFSATSA